MKSSVSSRWSATLLIALSIGLVLGGCSSEDGTPKGGKELAILSFGISPSSIELGGEATLSWSTRGAERLELLAGDELLLDTTTKASGTLEVRPTQSTIYSLIATRGSQELREEVILTISDLEPTIVRFEAQPTVVTAGADDEVVVSWQVAGATALQLELGEQAVDLGGQPLEGGEISLVVNESATLRLVATNDAGSSFEDIELSAVPAPEIVALTATPSRVGANESFELSWQTTGAQRIELERDGLPIEIDETQLDGSVEQTIAASSTYTLRAFNEAGASATQSLEVEVGGPRILSFAVDRAVVVPASALSFSWRTEGASEAAILGEDLQPVAGCSTSDLGAVREGGCTVDAPSELGSYTYTLVVRDGAGEEASEERRIHVSLGPVITLFEISPTELFVGEELTLRWRTETDAAGALPTLSLEDDGGENYDLSSSGIAEGSLVITPARHGRRTFTLIATTPETTPASAQATVEILRPAGIHFYADPPEFDAETSSFVSLRWEGVELFNLELWELNEEGAPIPPALHSTSNPEELEEGGFDVAPRRETTYRVVAIDLGGATHEAEVVVTLKPAEIVHFTAAPEQVYQHSNTLLSWETARTDYVELDLNPDYVMTITDAPYIDLREDENARELDPTAACHNTLDRWDEGCVELDFGDFAFPLGGVDHKKVRVHVNGFLDFDIERGPQTSLVSRPMPEAARGWNDAMAVFWSDLYNDPVNPKGKILYVHGRDERGNYLIIQWSKLLFNNRPSVQAENETDFQVILWEDGAFDYRYRLMTTYAPLVLQQEKLDGSRGTIGFQYKLGMEGIQLSRLEAIPGGLTGRGFAFRPYTLTSNGSLLVGLIGTQSFTLTAYGEDGSVATKTINVMAAPPPRIIQGYVVSASAVESGDPFGVVWKTSGLVSVSVLGEDGELCHAAADEVDFGSCEINEARPGIHSYTIRGEGAFGEVAEKTVKVEVLPALKIDVFSATPEAMDFDALVPVTLTWETSGATSLRLLRGEVEVDLQGQPSDSGALSLDLETSAAFTLIIESEDGRSRSAELRVDVRTLSFDSLQASHLQTAGESPVTIDWSTTVRGEGLVSVISKPALDPWAEVGDAPFEDIRSAGGVALEPNPNASGSIVHFPAQFKFPYFGIPRDRVRISMYGFASFADTAGSEFGDQHMRLLSGQRKDRHLPIFWTNALRFSSEGKVHTKFIEVPGGIDHFIIQWSKMSFNPVPPTMEHDLNFQIVLFEDGSFEYRYGTMASTTKPAEAGGSNAAIGFQDDDGRRGYEFSFNANPPLQLSNHSYRHVALNPSGSMTVTPSETTTYEICVSLAEYQECRDTTVVVPQQGDLIISELYLEPASSGDGQWFEIRNVSSQPIDLRGMSIVATSGTHEITSPLVVAPGDFAVFANGPTEGFTPDHLFTLSSRLPAREGDLALTYGERTIAILSWNQEWSLPVGRSLSLDPGHLKPGLTVVSDFGWWCDLEPNPWAIGGCKYPDYILDPFSAHSFVDIATTGHRLKDMDIASGFSVVPGGIGFSMPFFDQEVEDVWVSSAGYTSFLGAPLEALLAPVPELPVGGQPDGGIVAPYWTDLIPQAVTMFNPEASFFAYERREIDGKRVLILQWNNFRSSRHVNLGAGGGVTFQVQLWEGGDIVIAYGDLLGSGVNAARHYGAGATVGLQEVGGLESVQYLHDEAILQPWQSLHFQRRLP